LEPILAALQGARCNEFIAKFAHFAACLNLFIYSRFGSESCAGNTQHFLTAFSSDRIYQKFAMPVVMFSSQSAVYRSGRL
jgi:hypothetical protein